MNKFTIALCGSLLIFGCSSNHQNPYGGNGTFGMMNNDRFFGTIVSINTSSAYEVNNAGTAAGAEGAGFLSGLTASSILGPITGAFSSGASNAAAASPVSGNETTSLHYVIRKDDGKQITIDQPAGEGEDILYPGQRAIIQSNGEYYRVYPADVEDNLSRHVPGAR